MQADVTGIQDELMMCQMRVADFESTVLALQEGDKGILIRLAKFMKTAEDIETLKVVSSLNRQIQSLMFSRNNRRN